MNAPHSDHMATVNDIRNGPEGRRQIVLVLQGGGALGAYQAGVYQALHEAGIEPDWIIGTSIGAINAGLIAGNEVPDRIARLRDFWSRMERRAIWDNQPLLSGVSGLLSYWATLSRGVPGFFEPYSRAFLSPYFPLGADHAGYYSTAPLLQTLTDLIDPSLLNGGQPRLTVGAAHVRSSEMRYFDSREGELTLAHVVASGALPPAFPAVRIDGELYWDGGILSNTPTEAVFDDFPRRNSLVFAAHMWHPQGPEPETLWQVFDRQKNIQYSSRVASHIERQRQIHRLRHVITELAKHVPDHLRKDPALRELIGYGCVTRMHIVTLLAPPIDNEGHIKDVDFSVAGIRARWDAGLADTRRVLEQAPWEGEFDPLEGAILHEPVPGATTAGDWKSESISGEASSPHAPMTPRQG